MGHTAVFGATGGGKTSFPPMLQFEFHAYGGDESGVIAAQPTITTERMASHSAARAKAGRIAKQIGGPVDLALAGAALLMPLSCDWAWNVAPTTRYFRFFWLSILCSGTSNV